MAWLRTGTNERSGMDLDKSLEEAWRGLVEEAEPPNIHWLKKDVEKLRQIIKERRAGLLFAEIDLAAGERVLAEHDKQSD